MPGSVLVNNSSKYYRHLMDEDAEAQGNEIIYPR